MSKPDPDERFKIEGDPEEALQMLLQVDPESGPADPAKADKPEAADAPLKDQGDALGDPALDERCPYEGWGVNRVQRCVLKRGHIEPHRFNPGK